jgi:NADP-dependent 3-hydroxy acid dehydrogenase YdfG
MSNPSTAGQLDGKLALVTGDGSGIGEATARFFALEGAIVVVAGRRRKQIETVAADIYGHAIVCDVSDPGQV